MVADPLSSPDAVALDRGQPDAAAVGQDQDLCKRSFLLDQIFVALAGKSSEGCSIHNGDNATSVGDHAPILHFARNVSDGGPADAEHFSQQFLRQCHRIASGAVRRLQQPTQKRSSMGCSALQSAVVRACVNMTSL
jgi:hypothetical protein